MRSIFQRGLVVLLLLTAIPLHATDSFTWKANRVSADIKSMELRRLLEDIARLTGWQVYLESNTTLNVSAKFKELPPGEALRLLLGDLNFALVPQTNSRSRLYVFRTSQANATQRIQPPNSASAGKAHARAIPNELIVRLKPGANIDDLAKKLGAKVVGKMDGLNAYRLQFADEAAANAARAQLKNNSDVASVEFNYVFDPPPPAEMLANAPVGPVSLTLNPSNEGDPCKPIVALIDTHVQSLGSDLDKFILKRISVAGEANPAASEPTHGTAMAETILRAIAQVAGGSSPVQIVAVNVYGAGEMATTWNVALGIQAAATNGATALNMSLGSDSDSAVLSDVIRQALGKGIVIFAAAGNQAANTPTYPAAIPGVNAVTATQQGKLAPYANFGSYVSYALPGASVVYLGGQAYVVQGTSVATAYATGVAAGTRGQNCLPWGQIQSAMQQKFPVPQN